MNGKKGAFSMVILVGVIFSLVTLAVFLVLFKTQVFVGLSLFESGTCSADAIQKNFQNSLSEKIYDTFDANRYLENCKISVKHITENKHPKKEDVDKVFADEAVKCYSKFQGLDIFPSGQKGRGFARQPEGDVVIWQHSEKVTLAPVQCVICSKIVFEPDYQGELYRQTRSLPMFTDYLLNTTKPGTSQSLYDFIDGQRHKEYYSGDVLQRYSYDPDSQNVIIFYKRYPSTSTLVELTTWKVGDDFDTLKKDVGFPDGNDILRPVSTAMRDLAKRDLAEGFEESNHPYTVGLTSYYQTVGKLGAYRLFSVFADESPMESGVASIPYEFVSHQCDFLANGYGE